MSPHDNSVPNELPLLAPSQYKDGLFMHGISDIKIRRLSCVHNGILLGYVDHAGHASHLLAFQFKRSPLSFCQT